MVKGAIASWGHALNGPSTGPDQPRCNASNLAGHEASFRHWHFCDREPGHEGRTACMSCKAEFGR